MTERFTLLTELGRGGMGVVWKARDEETGQIVALKLLREAYAEDPEYLARFERELELARRIDSVHVVKVLGFGVREKLPYLALEYVDGPSLHAALVAHGPYSWQETRALLIQLTQGLADANAAGVIHRDVKPSNVLMGPDGVAKLTDFGIARGIDTTRMTATSTMLGTPAYLAPEGPKDARSDLYSLGIIGYELLAGAVPFKGTSHQEVIFEHVRTPPDLNRLPPEARPIIGMLLAKDPKERPQRASALLPILYGVAPVIEAQAPASWPTGAPPSMPSSPGQQPPTATPPAWGQTPPTSMPNAMWTQQAGRDAGWAPHPQAKAHSRGSSVLLVASIILMLVAVYASARLRLPTGLPTVVALGIPAFLLVMAIVAVTRRKAPASSSPRRSARPIVALGAAGLVTCLLAATLIGGFPLLSPTPTPTPTPTPLPQPTGHFAATGSMGEPRAGHTATLLSDGRVLIAGGYPLGGGDCSNAGPAASAELYSPKTGRFSPTGSMTVARGGYTATLLSDGRVLIAGGYVGSEPVASAELYDPKSGTFSPAGSMTVARANQTATLLSDARVLIAGGYDRSNQSTSYDGSNQLTSAELYDPKTRTFSPTGSMVAHWGYHTATLLSDGRVLILGGDHNVSVELYDPKTGIFKATGSMTVARAGATSTLLPDGRVLIAGGSDGLGAFASAVLYDPSKGTFASTGSTATIHFGGQTATLLADGRVFIVGGSGLSGDLFDPKTGAFSSVGSMAISRVGHTATLLGDGHVLIAGGGDGCDSFAEAEIYTP